MTKKISVNIDQTIEKIDIAMIDLTQINAELINDITEPTQKFRWKFPLTFGWVDTETFAQAFDRTWEEYGIDQMFSSVVNNLRRIKTELQTAKKSKKKNFSLTQEDFDAIENSGWFPLDGAE